MTLALRRLPIPMRRRAWRTVASLPGALGAQNEGLPMTHYQRQFRRYLWVLAAIGFLIVTGTLAVKCFGEEAALFGMAVITIVLGSLLAAIWLDRRGAHLDW